MNASGTVSWPTDPEDYNKQALIGYGASARVHVASLKDKRICALKILDLESLLHDDVLEEIRKELTAMSLCRHRNIVSHHTSFPFKRQVYIVMPLCRGGSCSDLLRCLYPNGFNSGRAEDLGIMAHILKEATTALAYLHDPRQSQVHRDVKAANLLIKFETGEEEEEGCVCLGDFGVAASLKDCRTRQTFVGTPCWLAPEIIKQIPYGSAADIWSLGITALELCSGSAPYQRSTPHHLQILQLILERPPPAAPKEVGNDFQELIHMCLQKEPEKRLSAKEILEQSEFLKRADRSALIKALGKLPPLEDRRKMKNAPTSGGTAKKDGTSTDSWCFDLPEVEGGEKNTIDALEGLGETEG